MRFGSGRHPLHFLSEQQIGYLPGRHYRDKDGVEIDLLIEKDNILYPIEIKSAASIKRVWAKPFYALDKLDKKRGPGAVICLAGRRQPVADKVTAVPIHYV
ncbi:MAG TPA: hypothetical protein GXX29_07140 [Firmicutes bacterium]|nr:hypothetical protein [Bacillota bacterium]